LSHLTDISYDLSLISKGVSDGISMGTSGMRYSLQSRDLVSGFMELFFIFLRRVPLISLVFSVAP
jgi:hypothetical protein